MRKAAFALVVAFATGAFSDARAGVDEDLIILRRGDSNNDGYVNSADISHISSYLFSGGAEPPCLNQADVNHDGVVSISDATYLSNFLYQGGPEPPAPGPFNTTCATTDPWISCEVLPCG